MIGVHEARRAFQVAPVGQVHNQGEPTTGVDARNAVIVDNLVISASEIVPNVKGFHPLEERGVSRQDVFERAVPCAFLSHHDSTRVLDNLRIDYSRIVAELR
jgi:hypothetical protein